MVFVTTNITSKRLWGWISLMNYEKIFWEITFARRNLHFDGTFSLTWVLAAFRFPLTVSTEKKRKQMFESFFRNMMNDTVLITFVKCWLLKVNAATSLWKANSRCKLSFNFKMRKKSTASILKARASMLLISIQHQVAWQLLTLVAIQKIHY